MRNKKSKREDQVNDVLQRMQEGLLTQNLTIQEVRLLVGRFGHNWFEDLGYHKLKPNKEPRFKKL